MKEITSNIKYATYLDKFEVVSFIEKCLFENKLGFFPLSNDEDLSFFDKIYTSDNMLIFKINGKLVGTIAYIIEERNKIKSVKIVRFYLDSSIKGKGYGKILLMTLLSIIRIKHYEIKIAYLTTNSEKMKIAYNMYKSFGFEESKDFKISLKRSNVLLKLQL